MRYLDPKADLTFQRVFGQNPDRVISLLNASLPLASGQKVTAAEYAPDNPFRKNSLNIARTMKVNGFWNDDIAKITGLSPNGIETL